MRIHKLLIPAIIIIAILAIAPFFIGKYTETVFNAAITKANKSGSEIQVIHYDRGWFTSHARILVKNTHAEPNMKKPVELESTFEIHITHGPVIINLHGDNQTRFLLGLSLIESDMQRDSDTVQGQIFTEAYIGFAGEIHAKINAPTITLHMPPMTSLRIRNMRSAIVTNKHFNTFTTDSSIEEATVNVFVPENNRMMQLDINNISMNKNQHDLINKLWSSEVSTHIGAMKMHDSKVNLTTHNIQYNLNTIVNEKTLSVGLKTSFHDSTINDKPLGDLALQANIDNVDTSAISAMQDFLIKNRSNNLATNDKIFPEFMKLTYNIFNKGFDLSIGHLMVKNPLSEVTVTGSSHVLANDDTNAKFDFEKQVKANLSISVPNESANSLMAIATAILKQSGQAQLTPSQQLTTLLEAGVLKQNAKQYYIDLLLKDGHISINDKTLNEIEKILTTLFPIPEKHD